MLKSRKTVVTFGRYAIVESRDFLFPSPPARAYVDLDTIISPLGEPFNSCSFLFVSIRTRARVTGGSYFLVYPFRVVFRSVVRSSLVRLFFRHATLLDGLLRRIRIRNIRIYSCTLSCRCSRSCTRFADHFNYYYVYTITTTTTTTTDNVTQRPRDSCFRFRKRR